MIEKFANLIKSADWTQQFDAQGNPMYWDPEAQQWITQEQLNQKWLAAGNQGAVPLTYQRQHLKQMTPEEKEKIIQQQIAALGTQRFQEGNTKPRSDLAVWFPQTGTTDDRGVVTPGYRQYWPMGKQDLPIPEAEGEDSTGRLLHPNAWIEDPNNPGQELDLSQISVPQAPEGFSPTSFHYDPREQIHTAFYDEFDDKLNDDLSEPVGDEPDPREEPTKEFPAVKDPKKKNYKKYDDLPAAGKALAWGKGTWEVGKNLLAQPNKEIQTKPWDLPVRGPEAFGVTTSKTSTYGDGFDHPSTVSERNEDPENGKLFPSTRTQTVDGPLGDQEWQRDYMDVNEIGQSRDIRGDDYEQQNLKRLIASDDKKQKAIEKFFDTLPLIMEFFHSEESGMNNPIVKSVHEALEDAFPGYLNLAVSDEENPILIMLNESENYKEANMQPMQVTPQPPQTPSATVGGYCKNCGNVAGPAQLCQDCSADSARAFAPAQRANITHTPELNITGKIASDTQGPHTNEQQAAVAEYLIEEDREDEIPNMLENPADYDSELAEIQNKQPMLDESPEDIGMGAQDQMAQMGMGPEQGGSPAGPPMGGEMPPGLPGAAPGIPDMSAPTPADLNPAGPGAMPPPIMASVTSSMLDAAFRYGADSVAGTCPKCDGHTTKMMQQDGKSKCHSCNHEWADETFQKSDGDSSHSVTTSSFYAALDSFVEEDDDPEPEIDESSHTWTDEDGEPIQEGQEYEIYASNYEIPDIGRVVEVKPDAIVYEIESDGGLRTTIEIDRQEADLNGYRFAPTSSGDVEENPSGFGIEDKIAPEPGQTTDLATPHREIGASAKEAAAQFYMCPEPNCEFNKGGGDYEPGKCSIHNVDLVPAGQEKRAFKTAGKHYTPMEQRELIDEYGQARNADKLNLEGTHYADSDPDYFLFGC